jgi:hypothetical protein
MPELGQPAPAKSWNMVKAKVVPIAHATWGILERHGLDTHPHAPGYDV